MLREKSGIKNTQKEARKKKLKRQNKVNNQTY